MYSAIEHFVNMALYKCCILLFIIIYYYYYYAGFYDATETNLRVYAELL